MDVSAALDVAAARDGDGADFVQSDLRHPPFAPETAWAWSTTSKTRSRECVRSRSSCGREASRGSMCTVSWRKGLSRRWLLAATTTLRRVTMRLPYAAVHLVSWVVAATATVLFLWSRRILRGTRLGDRLTRELPRSTTRMSLPDGGVLAVRSAGLPDRGTLQPRAGRGLVSRLRPRHRRDPAGPRLAGDREASAARLALQLGSGTADPDRHVAAGGLVPSRLAKRHRAPVRDDEEDEPS